MVGPSPSLLHSVAVEVASEEASVVGIVAVVSEEVVVVVSAADEVGLEATGLVVQGTITAEVDVVGLAVATGKIT